MYTAGEPVRIVTGGYPEVSGGTILDKRREAREQHNHHRSNGCCNQSADHRVANPKLDAEPVHESASDERSDKTGNYVSEQTRTSDEYACQPACNSANRDLSRNSALIKCGECFVVDA